MLKIILAAATLTGSVFAFGAASAAPLSLTSGAAPGVERLTSEVQYRSRTVTRSTRVIRPGRVCTVRTVRTRTPRGTVVRRIRTCR